VPILALRKSGPDACPGECTALCPYPLHLPPKISITEECEEAIRNYREE
jgi:hypothetical protein